VWRSIGCSGGLSRVPGMSRKETPIGARWIAPKGKFASGSFITVLKEMFMPPVKPVPEGMHTGTPHLVCAGAADAVEFYKRAVRALEMARLPGPQGKLAHAMIRIGDSVVMLVDEFPERGALSPTSLKGSPVTIHLYVDDVDATVERAVKAGAKITMPVAD